MIKIAICDDEPIFVSNNKTIVEQFIKRKKEIVTIDEYFNGEFLLADIQEGAFFDLILLDIEMPYKNAMKLTPIIKDFLPHVLIIFITSYLKYAVDSFSLSIFRYIPKQELTSRLNQTLEDAFNLIKLEQDEAYIIQTKTTFKRLLLKDILYIQKSGKNLIFVTLNGQIKLRKSLKEIYTELNHNEFIYIDKGCIVNIIHIMQIKNGEIILRNKESLSISRSHIQPTQKLISTFWGNHI